MHDIALLDWDGAVTLDRTAGRYQNLDHRARAAAGFELMSETHPQYSRNLDISLTK
jgi:hypothetical protein